MYNKEDLSSFNGYNMARKSSHADRKLISEGRRLLIKKGASSLSIRELADAAGVNLGMFSYYFRNKETFTQIILEEIYNDFLSDLAVDEESDDLENLRRQLLVMAKFARDNRVLILSLLNDVLNKERAVQKFVRAKMNRHFLIIAKTVKRCQRKGIVINGPLPLILTQIVGSIGLSNLIPEAIKRLGINKAFNNGIGTLTKSLTSDDALYQRVDMTLRGLKAETSVEN